MHFCFIDGSGTGEPNPKNPDDVLVLAGVIVPEAMFDEFSQRVDAIKSSFGLNPNDEIHSCRLDNEIKGQGIEEFEQMTSGSHRGNEPEPLAIVFSLPPKHRATEA